MPYIGQGLQQGRRQLYTFTATARQTTFSASYTPGYVDVYQNGNHTHNLDIHVDDVEHDLWQDGAGTHYSHVYYYGNSDASITNLKQEGTGNHNAQIVLTGNYLTTLNVLQQGSNNQSYNLTQNCQTVGGCTVNVTQN